MFLLMGITSGQKELPFRQVAACISCGSYAAYQVFITFSVFSLFFIPILRWNKKYYVRTTCCNTVFQLDENVGRRIARGEQVQIMPEHLQGINGHWSAVRRCASCGFSTMDNFDYCPKCGRPLSQYEIKTGYRICVPYPVRIDIGERGSESTFPYLEGIYRMLVFEIVLYLAGLVINLPVKCIEVSGI